MKYYTINSEIYPDTRNLIISPFLCGQILVLVKNKDMKKFIAAFLPYCRLWAITCQLCYKFGVAY